MAAILVFVLVLFAAVKTFSYGVWEAKRKNVLCGIFAISLAFADIFLAAGYLIKYWT